MVVTYDIELPSVEELTVPEVRLSSPALRAGAFHLGKYCQETFNVSFCDFFINLRFVHQLK